MNRAAVDHIADAILYEGYILYPYRPSIKNRQRWTFGGLYPEAFCQPQSNDACSSQTECLVQGDATTTIEIVVRFLHLTARVVGEIDPPLAIWLDDVEPPYRTVERLRVGDQLYHTWQEAEAREVDIAEMTLGGLLASPRSQAFTFQGSRRLEPLSNVAPNLGGRSENGRRNPAPTVGAGFPRPEHYQHPEEYSPTSGSSGEIVGALVREQQAIKGVIEASAKEITKGLYRVTLRVANQTPMEKAGSRSRDEALLRSLISTHVILGIRSGEFVSLLDPPERCREAANACRNIGTWPVLVGVEGQKDMMLSSPIILYDYPQVAPESPGDFFDGTEIDEMLTLRIMTMTDEEKNAMAAVDKRAHALLARTEAMTHEQMGDLHGVVRGLQPVQEEHQHG